MSFSEWREYSIDDIAISYDKKRIPLSSRQRELKKGVYPYYGASGIIDYIDDFLFDGEFVLISEDGENLKTRQTPIAFKVNGQFWVNNHAHIYKGIEPFLNDWIVYYFKKLDVFPYITGAVQPKLNQENLKLIKIKIPDFSEAKKIVSILSTLDEKIELNRQTNTTLEAIAQAIFKEWFVDFNYPNATGELIDSPLGPIPKGWQVARMGEVIVTIESGSRPKGGVGYLSEGIPSIGAENIIGLGAYDYSKEKYVSEDFYSQMKNGIVKSGDVLLYKDGASIGRKSLFMDDFPHKKCAINEHVFILRSNESINQIYLYFWLDQDFMTENIKSLNANSAQPGINRTGVSSMPIMIPDQFVVKEFEHLILPLLRKLFNNCKESVTLTQMRDSLLPKLLNGEIEV